MRLFVDTEFNGFGGELMSMAIVSEFGDEWYEVLPLPDVVVPWVKDNVVPVLNAEPVSGEAFRESFLAFMSRFRNPTIVADWYTDIVHFFAMFGGKDHNESVGYACKAELVLIDRYDSLIPHNALHDARAIRDAYRCLHGVIDRDHSEFERLCGKEARNG
ncbi:hypothetical protein [Sinorhizobium sp. 22678]|uniref:hypothetical protein n=1 Tax=Sinorhizobium sp. 22678 TaxID=3453955 RepID=UPI003F82D797